MARSLASVVAGAGLLVAVLAGCGSAARPTIGGAAPSSQAVTTPSVPPPAAQPAAAAGPAATPPAGTATSAPAAPDTPAAVVLSDPATPADTKVLLDRVDQIVKDADDVLANG